jgi:hypothetical protein
MINLGVFNDDESEKRICHVEKYLSLLFFPGSCTPLSTIGGHAHPGFTANAGPYRVTITILSKVRLVMVMVNYRSFLPLRKNTFTKTQFGKLRN